MAKVAAVQLPVIGVPLDTAKPPKKDVSGNGRLSSVVVDANLCAGFYSGCIVPLNQKRG